MSLKKHKGSRFSYQIINKGGFSPLIRAKRVYEQLNFNIKKDTTPEDFLEYLLNNYPKIYNAIEWIKFFPSYCRSFNINGQKREIEFRIALLYIKPDPIIRKKIFSEKLNITAEIGWYPSTMGSKAMSCHYKYKEVSPNDIMPIGEIKSILQIEDREFHGVSFELKGTRGCYLLDCGAINRNNRSNNYDIIFLSHHHRDHCDSVIETLHKNPHALLLSSVTTLVTLNTILYTDRKKDILAKRAYKLDFNQKIQFKDGGSLSFFPVYHCPGSFGLKYIDSADHHFTYFGDFCLRNGFHDIRGEIIERVITEKGTKNTVLLDTAMIGKKYYIDKDDTPQVILDDISKDAVKRNMFIISNQAENLIYCYLHAWKVINDLPDLGQRKILVSKKLYNTLRTLWRPIVYNKKDFQDPVMKKLTERQKQNPIETFRLYPLSGDILSKIDSDEKCIFFIELRDLVRIRFLKKRLAKADVFIAGTMALRDELPDIIYRAKAIHKILRISSEDWSFHSKEEDLKEFVDELVKHDIKVLFFHNSFKRLLDFVNTHKYSQRNVCILKAGKTKNL